MESGTVGFEDPVRAGGMTIIPVARILKSAANRDDNFSFLVRKEPAAVIIRQADGCRIFNEKWEEVPPDDFMRNFPDNIPQLRRLFETGEGSESP